LPYKIVMLDKSEAIKITKQDRPDSGPRYTYIFRCSYRGCEEIVSVRSDALKNSSGKCKTHSHTKRPFESIYNRLFHDWRKPIIELTYEQFLKFTKINMCHYCGVKISRQPFPTVKGKYGSSAYFLDRKDPRKPYCVRNCVVCCTRCNFVKGARFTYKEFLIIGTAIAQIRFKKGLRYGT
jgi:hypothetical protein